MSARWVWTSLLACALAACEPLPEITVDQVFRLSECPEGFACDKVADGNSSLTVEACADDAIETRSSEQITLTLSSGHWEGMDATGRSLSRSLQADPCVRPTFITGADFTTVRVDAELKGFRRTLQVELQPAPIVDVELTTFPLPLKSKQQNQIQLRLDTKNNGRPTNGTYVRLTATAEPGNAQIGIWPDRAFLDANNGVAAQILTTAETTQVTLKVQVFMPDSATTPAFEKSLPPLPVEPPES